MYYTIRSMILPSARLYPNLSPGRGAGPPAVSRREASTVVAFRTRPASACVPCGPASVDVSDRLGYQLNVWASAAP